MGGELRGRWGFRAFLGCRWAPGGGGEESLPRPLPLGSPAQETGGPLLPWNSCTGKVLCLEITV